VLTRHAGLAKQFSGSPAKMLVYCDNLDVFEDSVQFRIFMPATEAT